MGKLDGKVALVTGAGRGIGRGIAHLMAQEGAAVVVNDLGASLDGEGVDTGPAATVADEIEAMGGQAIANTDSITDYDAVGAMVENAIDTFGKLDIVVNVAGILRDRMLFNMEDHEWDAVIDVHLRGTFNTCRHASAHFRERREGGRIINFSSTSAWGSPGQPNYAAAKYGILGLTATLANSMNRYGVTANAILPYAATRMIDSTPRAEKVREETGKLPSELAIGSEGDPCRSERLYRRARDCRRAAPQPHGGQCRRHRRRLSGRRAAALSRVDRAGDRTERDRRPAQHRRLPLGANCRRPTRRRRYRAVPACRASGSEGRVGRCRPAD